MVKQSEHRDGERLPIELRVGYYRLETFMADYTTNFSKGGMFIRSMHPLSQGTSCLFRIELPGFEKPLELRGEVSWRNTAHSYENPTVSETGMGIRFIFDSEQERQALEAFVDEMVRPRLKASA